MKINIFQDDIWHRLQKTKRPIIIYGMGNGADKIMDELERLSVPVYGVMASDSFVRGQSFRGFTVKKLSDFEKEKDDLIIITAFGSSLPDVINNIINISKRYSVLAVDVPVYGEKIFNINFVKSYSKEIKQAYDLMADGLSKKVFENEIKFKLSGKIEYLIDSFSEKDEAFENILKLGENESYLDLGAYRGDTIQEFLNKTNGKYSSIIALEPDKKNFKKLKEYAGNFKNTRLFNMGIWSDDTDLAFNSSLGRGSSIQSGGVQKLAVTKIDTLYHTQRLTYLKIDVEGTEYKALVGAKNTLKRDKPKLNIAAYHRSEDIFLLPFLIHSINPEYKMYLRQHPHIPAWDMNIYCK